MIGRFGRLLCALLLPLLLLLLQRWGALHAQLTERPDQDLRREAQVPRERGWRGVRVK